jgi:hypothetical protein
MDKPRGRGGNEIDEPLAHWELANRQLAEQLSDDLKSMRVLCQLNLEQVQSGEQAGKPDLVKLQADGEYESTECGKVLFGSPG